MTSPYDLMVKIQGVRNRLLDETENIIYRNENKIIQLNASQIEQHVGFDNKILQNTDKVFTGFYRSNNFTESGGFHQIGQPYNFTDSGNFFRGFYVEVLPNLVQIEIGSTGTGTGDKATFFRGYTNIFGLTSQNQLKLNYEIILPEIQKFVKQQIG
ncbi:hypothetical protein lillamy94_gp062 [Flavobacterium phage vB_FspS_lillamy9-4]|uniref:Uncharacterized protein n=7 Tax=Lillamyvirus TaxID=2843418 RepID=A0A6B9LAP6_9CAUD|nr:hypothetical protein HWC89_gp59 [Flavobacterium phage vB_FspS_hemulen6-1]YP_009855199.1 hypothetical protein HWC95_gp63 [Flavobacterium phage vB_FspS_sniff9-1]YP_009855411.1 hypothetical protein HWC98_gp56 [Flavobacterium phage vB_FspS_stinky9-1]QHB38890.1 hypothetical protein hemulen62_gp059 [Flavobacterium phage vB_FspS_hemulen6-2]QHB38960.1 hypothetical protein hemulen91_gp059 [Flavobacterium phage vB_FspS_hemulen9-1]QHB39236.1 hypothetical protein lillamy93_gp062 [Flavobacterium phage v